MFVSWPSILANYLLILLMQQGFNHKWVKELGLLDIRLVAGLIAGVFSQLGLLFTEIILGLETNETVWVNWVV